MRLAISLLAVVLAQSVVAQEWQHNHPQFDPAGNVTLNTLSGITSQLSNINQQGLQSSASPTILAIDFNNGASNIDFKHAIKVSQSSTSNIYLISDSGYHKIVDGQFFDSKYSYDSIPVKLEYNLSQITSRYRFSGVADFNTNNHPFICEYPEYSGLHFEIEISGCQFMLKAKSNEPVLEFRLNYVGTYRWFSYADQGEGRATFIPELSGFDGGTKSWSSWSAVSIRSWSAYENTMSWNSINTRFYMFEGADIYLIQFPSNMSGGPFGDSSSTPPGALRGVTIISGGHFISTQLFINGSTHFHYLNNIQSISPPLDLCGLQPCLALA